MHLSSNAKIIFAIFIILVCGTWICQCKISRYTQIGKNMLTGKWETGLGDGWKADIQDDGIFLDSKIPLKGVHICQEIPVFKPGMLLLLSADMKCREVKPGHKSWNRPMLSLVQSDGETKGWRSSQGVTTSLKGTMDWGRFDKVFAVNEMTKKLTVVASMNTCTGSFELKNVHLVQVVQRSPFIWAKRTILFLWAVLGFYFWGSCLVEIEIAFFSKIILSLIFFAIIICTSIPGNLKKKVVTDVAQGAEAIKEIVAPMDKGKIQWSPEKTGHFCLFALFGVILISVLEQDGRYTALVYMLMVAAGTEFAQIYIDGRSGSLGDFFIDASGCCLGIMIAVLCRQLKNKKGIGSMPFP